MRLKSQTLAAATAAMIAGVLAAVAMPAAAQPAPPIIGGPPIAGGWSPVADAAANPRVLAAARAAAGQLPGGNAAGVKVVSARQQVVAGMNYQMEIVLADGSHWDVTVWAKLDGGHEMTKSTRLPATKPAPTTPPVAGGGSGLQLAANGVVLSGGRPVRFGTPQAQVLSLLAARGKAKLEMNSECGAGPIEFASWPDGLNLLFQDGKFGGWSINDGGQKLATTKGLRMGGLETSLRAAGPVSIERSTLGREFTAGGISGILSEGKPPAKITALWAGLSCVFR
ncbi:hypothetical protein GTZ99_13440 [Novosphingobium sp. FSY-8]|uniref:Cystatin domain-containing protein n=1 Tax=Novosphingobium ovatum TaxID=1908523 RepID=A0ABW9XGE5_9SPHN|nr:cystatin domain-containing protein [Novosphingobium ovatum]NBC37553.1 hypothetical protein [Novosphingobium ovatum]